MARLVCPDCGSEEIEISEDALTGYNAIVVRILPNGDVHVQDARTGRAFRLSDLGEGELAHCRICSAEYTLAHFIQ